MTGRCLMLAPYPLARPRHGGQVRAASLRDALLRAGWAVTACGIYPAAFFPAEDRGPLDLPIEDAAVTRAAEAEVQIADLIAARAAASDPALVGRLAGLIAQSAPDIVLIEQPWPLLPLRAAGPMRVPLVYSSQNIEWRLRAVPPREGLGGDPARLAAEVRAIEEDAIATASLVLSISDIEEAELAAMGAARVVTYGRKSPLHPGHRTVDLGQVGRPSHRQGPVQVRKRLGRRQLALSLYLLPPQLPSQVALELHPLLGGRPVATGLGGVRGRESEPATDPLQVDAHDARPLAVPGEHLDREPREVCHGRLVSGPDRLDHGIRERIHVDRVPEVGIEPLTLGPRVTVFMFECRPLGRPEEEILEDEVEDLPVLPRLGDGPRNCLPEVLRAVPGDCLERQIGIEQLGGADRHPF